MNTRLLTYSLPLAALLVASCYRYTVVRLDREFSPGLSPLQTQQNMEAKSPTVKSVRHGMAVKKYYAGVMSISPVSELINRGVELAESGKFREAEIMFKEALNENREFWAAYNNLGIIYEISGMNDRAFDMYLTACMNEPDNELFRMNFQTFVDSGHEIKK